MLNQSTTDGSAVGDRLLQLADPGPRRLAAWRYFASIVAMAVVWGLLLLIAWVGKPGFLWAILLIYGGAFAAVSQLAILIFLPLLSPAIRIPISLALLLVVTCVIVGLFGELDTNEFHLWLALIAVQFVVVATASVVVIRTSRYRLRSSRHYSLLSLILTVTIICLGLGILRAIFAAFPRELTEFATSRWSSFLTVALLNSAATCGPILALASHRIVFGLLLLLMGAAQGVALALGGIWLHNWAIPDQSVMSYSEAAIFTSIQAVAVSLSLLPILLAPTRSRAKQKVDPFLASVLKQET